LRQMAVQPAPHPGPTGLTMCGDCNQHPAGRGSLCLSQAVARHPDVFPPIYLSMIRAGESGGVLDDVMVRLATTLENKYWIDELYDAIVVKPLYGFSTICWKVFDAIIDGLLSLGAYFIAAPGRILRFFQTGTVRNYAFVPCLRVVVFIWVYV